MLGDVRHLVDENRVEAGGIICQPAGVEANSRAERHAAHPTPSALLKHDVELMR